MRVLLFCGFILSLLCAGAGLAEIAGVPGVLMFGGALLGSWYTRERAPAGQARATIACGFGVGLGGVATANMDVATELAKTDPGAAQLIAIPSVAMVVAGLALCVYACRTLALAKGRSGLLAALGVFNIVGYTVVLLINPARTPAEVAGTPPVA